ncbi:type II secretion system F family protein [Pseudohaliea rubra]|uniref:General secretion pathway protein F n=1 Tax=Pseudohaliea rubra DSM 19751 TaxID=1265313 RepID=A0A095VTG1_9GAMM|nr:type II secretion system F family protein [Pseudohaliea rubra]KGE04747.1 General secretion pathway protein F [Pseudohaliea rubra DSM 19751]
MAQFYYRALGRDGRAAEGTIEADAPELATRQLRERGLTLLKLEPGAAAPGSGRAGKPPGRKEVLALTSELATLLRAGLPLDRALKVLLEMASTPGVRGLLELLLKDVKGGKALSAALMPHADIFGNFYINMVRSGEASGELSLVLDRLVETLENARRNRDSVVSALIYPAILLVVATLSIALMLVFVVPQFETLFEDMGEALPALTRAVLGLADFVAAWGWILLAVLGAGGFAAWRWLQTADGEQALHRRLLALPLLGGIVFEFEVAKFARTLGTLLGSGVPLLQSLGIAIDTVDNRVVRDALGALPPAVKSGRRVSASLEESTLFTPLVIQMARVGEESGRLDAMMLELARVFDDHVEASVKRALTLLEPVLILFMGFVIAVIIIAILMGILSVNNLAL